MQRGHTDERAGSACFALVPEGRRRVNTALIVMNFVAGALGSAAVDPLWSTGGWTAVTVAGIVVSARRRCGVVRRRTRRNGRARTSASTQMADTVSLA
jgi:hypothetical protein